MTDFQVDSLNIWNKKKNKIVMGGERISNYEHNN